MKKGLKRIMTVVSLFALSGVFLISGCAGSAKTLDQSVKGPQIIVNPQTVRTGIARIMDTDIVFSGAGFRPDDSVFIELLDVPVKGEKRNIAIAEADVEKDGTFDAAVGTMTKISDFLRASLGTNEKGENAPVITGPPMPPGIYTARAKSMLADRTAECPLEIKGPSPLDRIKDWLGVRMGKIIKK
ncbi:MAG: hypothetical protein ACOC6B_05295 [Thermodesulfobacteriota bacterium]